MSLFNDSKINRSNQEIAERTAIAARFEHLWINGNPPFGQICTICGNGSNEVVGGCMISAERAGAYQND